MGVVLIKGCHHVHALFDGGDIFRIKVPLVGYSARRIVHQRLTVVVGFDALDKVWHIPRAAVGDHGAVVGHLQGRHQVVRLANRRLDNHTFRPCGVWVGPEDLGHLLRIGGAGDHAVLLRELHACVLAEAVHGGVLVDLVDPQAVPCLIEENVAGVFQRMGHGDGGAVAVADMHTAEVHIGKTPVGILTRNRFILGDNALFQPRKRNTGLERRARGVGAQERAVPQWGVGRRGQLGIFFRVLGDVIVWVGGAGQDFTGVYINHHG